MLTEEIEHISLSGCWCVPLLTKYSPEFLASVVTLGGIGGVGPGTRGNGTNPEVGVKLILLIFSSTELTREVLITAHPCSVMVNPDVGVPPSKYIASVFFSR